MTDSLNGCCSFLGQNYSICANKLGAAPLMRVPFIDSAGVGTIVSAAAKIAGCVAPFWSILQMVFAICVGLHTAIVSPFQHIARKQNYIQIFIQSTLNIAWALRAGVINGVVFDLLKHLSIAFIGDNKYFLCFWDICSVVVLLPIIANPVCNVTTGAMIVGTIVIASLVSKYIGESFYISGREKTKPGLGFSIDQDSSATFFDSNTKTNYYKPVGMKELMELVGDCQVRGGYTDISIGLNRRVKNLKIYRRPEQLCSIFCLIKNADQIRYEDQIRSNSWLFKQLENIREIFALEILPIARSSLLIKERIKNQETMANELIERLESKIYTVRSAYSSFLVCGEKELLELGYAEKVAKTMHALVLFYKPLPHDTAVVGDSQASTSTEELSPEKREILRINSTLDSALKGRDCVELPVQEKKPELIHRTRLDGQIWHDKMVALVNSEKMICENSLIDQPFDSELKKRPWPTYFDWEFRTYYYLPPKIGKLAEFTGDCQEQGCYQGIGIGQKMKLKNLRIPNQPKQRCDIITLRKDHRQVEHETAQNRYGDSGIFSFFRTKINEIINQTSLVKKMKEKQKQLLVDVQIKLEEKMKDWHYDSFMIVGERALLTLGYSEKNVKEMHLLALFYKPVRWR